MIVKAPEAQLHAAHEVHRQVVHFLRRAFAQDPQAFVFHDLRLECRGDVAQIDHLILHRSGLVIVNSSVAGQLSVNEHGEGVCEVTLRASSLPSAVVQARRQLDLLLAFLEDHAADLMDCSRPGSGPPSFAGVRRDVLVALPADSRVTATGDLTEWVRPGQVPDRVNATIRAEDSRTPGLCGFTATELTRIRTFLLTRHVPAPVLAAPVPRTARPVVTGPVRTSQERQAQARPRLDAACRSCGGTQLSVEVGKYGASFRCAGCGATTPAKPVCAQCGQPGKLSRKGRTFTATCAGGHTWPYWTNPE
ncbi:NERD domain-containing protein [Deinococcus taeanensis]|uniref:nuclease-related domain-containing protein n=1 Tax=Deinococcus taeanensis TaxID=2737050 RepID=UPI001CDD2D62|nr:nuclease-related domain-containing protein [Deinococcus taeanensis]UBV41742.1 NERD domain-containing protein [Deinococcus taeanensis]